jgi:hypothetical protein
MFGWLFNQREKPKDIKPVFYEYDGVKHIIPQYYRYKKGFANLTICRECQAVGLYEDAHPVNPCHFCGGIVDDDNTYQMYEEDADKVQYVGIWENDKWRLRK